MKLKPNYLTLSLLAASLGGSLLIAQDREEWKLPAETTRFKPAPRAALVTANCLLCHSADYVSMQPPLDRTGWTAIVQKMRKTYGAPLPEERVESVVDYLVEQYGKSASNQ